MTAAQVHSEDLLVLARSRFNDLTFAETALMQFAPTGWLASCSPSGGWDDPANEPSLADKWGPEREIRADLIRWLCINPTARDRVDPKGIQIFGARIVGNLDLSYATIPFRLAFLRCQLAGDAEFRSSSAEELDFRGSSIRSLGADRLNVKGGVFFRDGFRAQGEVRLVGARIASNLECNNSTFSHPGHTCLNVEAARVAGSVLLCNGFRSEGEVRLIGTEIGDNLSCDGGSFVNPSAMALHGDRAKIAGYVFLRNGASVAGEVNLQSAEIGGNLECDKGIFNNPKSVAFRASGASIRGSVFMRNGFSADGQVDFLGAEIGRSLECDGGKFRNNPREGGSSGGTALRADRVRVAGYVFFRNGFNAEGGVDLLNAVIGSDLDCRRGTFKNLTQKNVEDSGIALFADGASVQGSVMLSDGFVAHGDVRLHGGQIQGQLNCTEGAFDGTLNVQATTIKEALVWRDIVQPELASLDLINARAGALVDDIQSWPASGKLRLEGFVFDRFTSVRTPRSSRDRINWLRRQKEFARQPYCQVAMILRDEGDDVGAREVLFEMERLRRQKEDHGILNRMWTQIMRATVGYGYYPHRSLFGLAALMILCMSLFWGGYVNGSVVPVEKEAYDQFTQSGHLPSQYERFHASVYAVESSFPLVKLGQVDRWQADPGPLRPTHAPRAGALGWILSARFLRWFHWVQICLGWFLTTMFLAAVAGLVRKD